MFNFTSILLMAGDSTRFLTSTNKTLYEVFDKPLFLYSLSTILKFSNNTQTILVVRLNDKETVEKILLENHLDNVQLVAGGATRAESVRNGLQNALNDLVIIHDCARPNVQYNDIEKLLNMPDEFLCGSLYHKVTDTVRLVHDNKSITIPREKLRAITTPEIFRRECFKTILLNQNDLITDELMLFEEKYPIFYVEESMNNLKITSRQDLELFENIKDKNALFKVGHSFDFHVLCEGRPLILGGVTMPFKKGLLGHSDADCLYHSLSEAVLGALQLKDLGTNFPDTSDLYLNMDSSFFVKQAVAWMIEKSYHIENIDMMIYLEQPKLQSYIPHITKNICELTNCQYVSIKATTLEKKGLIGLSEGIGAEAFVLLKKD
jgi:2-C-methyl-D-erythritol 4-phosphate cytidylyltransferase / 2-C-methyl-D-erythritol 2,4-cyclodiphosphate synthase